jgi:hypothetical protein
MQGSIGTQRRDRGHANIDREAIKIPMGQMNKRNIIMRRKMNDFLMTFPGAIPDNQPKHAISEEPEKYLDHDCE